MTVVAVAAAGLSVPSVAFAGEGMAEPESLAVVGGEVPAQSQEVNRVFDAWTPPSVTWPDAASLPINLVRGGTAGPITVTSETGSASASSQVELSVAGRDEALAAGLDGVVMRVNQDGDQARRQGTDRVTVSVDYSGFRHAYGADWATRLRLVQIPECMAKPAVTRGACEGSVVPLPSVNSYATSTVSATVQVAGQGESARAGGPGSVYLALTAGDKGPQGDLKASSLQASSSWSSGTSAGAFGWSYPLTLPPVPGGMAPQLTLAYSSAAVDGRTAATNSQPGWAGDGWDIASAYIERQFTPCADDREGTHNNEGVTGDKCWKTGASENVVMHLNGKTTPLISNGKGQWYGAQHDGSKVTRATGAKNGARNGEHWIVTTAEGRQYHFGLNQLPFHTASLGATNSVWTMPVYGNHPGEPCYKANDYAGSRCTQAWRWNLDYVRETSSFRAHQSSGVRASGSDYQIEDSATSDGSADAVPTNDLTAPGVEGGVVGAKAATTGISGLTSPRAGTPATPSSNPGEAGDERSVATKVIDALRGGDSGSDRDVRAGQAPAGEGGASSLDALGGSRGASGVRDPEGTIASFWYAKETNVYAANNGATHVTYDRGGYLSTIYYGRVLPTHRDDAVTALTYPVKVSFDVDERCVRSQDQCLKHGAFSAANASWWPDVPMDKLCTTSCKQNTSPTLWSSKRLARIRTQLLTRNSDKGALWHRPVDTWTLSQNFPKIDQHTPGPGWLRSIQRTSYAATTKGWVGTPSPTQWFAGALMPNRVGYAEKATDAGADGTPIAKGALPAYSRYRVNEIRTDTGARIYAYYAPQKLWCGAEKRPANPAANTRPCFPMLWRPDEGTYKGQKIEDWFHHHLVTRVDEESTPWDPANARVKVASYQYANPAWAFDRGEFATAQDRTWSDFRGYGVVTVSKGGAKGDTVEKTTTQYFQGLHGDLANKGGLKSHLISGISAGSVEDLPELAGMAYRSTVFNGKQAASVTTMTPFLGRILATDRKPLPVGSGAPGGLKGKADLRARFASVGYERVESFIPGAPAKDAVGKPLNQWLITKKATTYTDHGRVVQVENSGDTGKAGDASCTKVEYNSSTTGTTWLIAFPSRVLTRKGHCADPKPVDATTLISDKKFFYDNPNRLGSVVSAGLVVATGDVVRYAVSNGSSTPVYRIARTWYDAWRSPVRTQAYDGTNATLTYVRPNRPTEKDHGPVIASVQRNQAGHSVRTVFEPGHGTPYRTVDANGKVTEKTLDSLGRVTNVYLPGNPAKNKTPDAKFAYTVPGNGYVSVVSQIRNSGDDPQRPYTAGTTLMDGLLRTVQTQAQAPSGTNKIVSYTEYDSAGRVKYDAQGIPMAKAPTTAFLKPTLNAAPRYSTHVYDGLGRATATAVKLAGVAAPQITRTVYSWAPERVWASASKQADGTWKAVYKDRNVVGTWVYPPVGAAVPVTMTAVDAVGRVVRQGRQGNGTVAGNAPTHPDAAKAAGTFGADTTYYLYDHAGRRTGIFVGVDPTTGTSAQRWLTGYDVLGRVVSSRDADTGVTTTSYDVMDRVTSTKNSAGDVVHTKYDQLGRVKSTHHGVDGPTVTSYTYDVLPSGAKALGMQTSSTRYVPGKGEIVSRVLGLDERYRPTSVSVTIPDAFGALGGTYTSSTTYTPAGQPRTRALPKVGDLGQATLRYAYSLTGVTTSVTQQAGDAGAEEKLVSGVDLDFDGSVKKVTLGDGAGAGTVFDSYATGTRFLGARNVSAPSVPGATPTVLEGQATTFDPVGNPLTQVSDIKANQFGVTPGVDVECYAMDGLTRLRAVWTKSSQSKCAKDPAPTPATAVSTVEGSRGYYTGFSFDGWGNRAVTSNYAAGSRTGWSSTYRYHPQNVHQLLSVITTGVTAPAVALGSVSTPTVTGPTAVATPSPVGTAPTSSAPGVGGSALTPSTSPSQARQDEGGAVPPAEPAPEVTGKPSPLPSSSPSASPTEPPSLPVEPAPVPVQPGDGTVGPGEDASGVPSLDGAEEQNEPNQVLAPLEDPAVVFTGEDSTEHGPAADGVTSGSAPGAPAPEDAPGHAEVPTTPVDDVEGQAGGLPVPQVPPVPVTNEAGEVDTNAAVPQPSFPTAPQSEKDPTVDGGEQAPTGEGSDVPESAPVQDMPAPEVGSKVKATTVTELIAFHDPSGSGGHDDPDPMAPQFPPIGGHKVVQGLGNPQWTARMPAVKASSVSVVAPVTKPATSDPSVVGRVTPRVATVAPPGAYHTPPVTQSSPPSPHRAPVTPVPNGPFPAAVSVGSARAGVDAEGAVRFGAPVSKRTFGYDAAGRMKSRTGVDGSAFTQTFSVEGRVSSVTAKDAQGNDVVTSMVYSADGSRILRDDPTSVTIYLGEVEATLVKASGTVIGTRIVGFGGHQVITAQGRQSVVIADRHGTGVWSFTAPRKAAAGSAVDVKRRWVTPYGEVRPGSDDAAALSSPPESTTGASHSTSTAAQPAGSRATPSASVARAATSGVWPAGRGFLGLPADASTGLTHVGARNYDPSLGSFISPDPVVKTSDPVQMQGFGYAGWNPVSFADPSGLAHSKDSEYGTSPGVWGGGGNDGVRDYGFSGGGGGGGGDGPMQHGRPSSLMDAVVYVAPAPPPEPDRGVDWRPALIVGAVVVGAVACVALWAVCAPALAATLQVASVAATTHSVYQLATAESDRERQEAAAELAFGLVLGVAGKALGKLNGARKVGQAGDKGGDAAGAVVKGADEASAAAKTATQGSKASGTANCSELVKYDPVFAAKNAQGSPISAVPPGSSVRRLTPHPNGGSQVGVEFKFTGYGHTMRVRVHGPDGTAPVGSNSANGVTYRVQQGGRYMDTHGQLYPRGMHNPSSPNYDPSAANATHIPWPDTVPLPWMP